MLKGEQEAIPVAFKEMESFLCQSISKDNEAHTRICQKAVKMAIMAVEVLGLGLSSVMAAFYAKFVSEGVVKPEEVLEKSGTEVAGIVAGFVRISGIHVEKPSLYSDNFRSLLLTLAGDIRVVLLKLLDKVLVMREIGQAPEKDQLRAAEETFYLYAPLAHRLGMYHLKTELEDNAMRITDPDMFVFIENKLKESKESREKYIRTFIQPVKKSLEEYGYQVEIKGRSKSVYSIWQKMKRQQVPFEKVYDVFAIRIILENQIEGEKEDCWRVYSIITDKYKPDPRRMRDWVSSPKKSTGYESLHATVMGPQNRYVEVQIRTRRMDNDAEKGQAAHWKYKEGVVQSNDEQRLHQLRATIENMGSNDWEQQADTRIKQVSDSIFVFTPDGDLNRLSPGSTVLDFAYRVHSRIGETCTGAIVNGKHVSIKQELFNGDTVKILTSSTQKPNSDWIKFVNSKRTQAKIRRSLRKLMYKNVEEGKERFYRKLNQLKISSTDVAVNKLLKYYKYNTAQDLYQAIGSDYIDLTELKKILTEEDHPQREPGPEKDLKSPPDRDKQVKGDVLLVGNENLGNYKLAQCCKPVFGDSIFAFVTVGQGIKIHRTSCPNARQLREKYPYRIMEARWYDPDEEPAYLAELRISGDDQLGVINQISEVISQDLKVNMHSISFKSKDKRFSGSLKIYVKEKQSLDGIFHKIMKIKGVTKVSVVS